MAIFGSSKTYTTVKSSSRKMEIPDGAWLKCKRCGRTLYNDQLEENFSVCPHCAYHFPMNAVRRIAMLTDENSFVELEAGMRSLDPLGFVDARAYVERLRESEQKTGLNEAVICGFASLEHIPYALGVMDFRFMGASMGSVVGEKITRLIEQATARKVPAVLVTASGGARMQEGILSLMQMPKTYAALARHAEAKLPYIVLITNPTYGGVTASFASLGDVIISEPDAMVGFAGPRVIQETTNSKLPDGFQTAEFLLEKGLIDLVVERKNLRRELGLFLAYFTK